MGIEHSICDGCGERFPDGEERVYPDTCPLCGQTQGKHEIGPWGWAIMAAVFVAAYVAQNCGAAS